jgi:metal-dependent amidase/aminoacylase/carboxypeptidase family protein
MRSAPLLLATILAGTLPASAQAIDPVAARTAIDAQITRDYPALDMLYRDLHTHPELGFQETRTAALLAAQMRKTGFTVTEKVGKTGVVAIYKNGPGPIVMIRTELDALPMEEKTGLPYASRAQGTLDGKTTFIAHSCGHDNHMAW